MGQTNTKTTRISSEQRKEREKLKTTTLNHRKQEIEQLQEELLKSHQNSREVIPVRDVTLMLQISETAKNQLDRGGGALTKSDLVAIIIALEPKYRKDLVGLNQLTISDLNSMIRSIIYDTSRILEKTRGDLIRGV